MTAGRRADRACSETYRTWQLFFFLEPDALTGAFLVPATADRPTSGDPGPLSQGPAGIPLCSLPDPRSGSSMSYLMTVGRRPFEGGR